MRRASIRFRITAIAVTAVALVLATVSVALVILQRTQLTASLDTSLRQRADDISALLASVERPPTEFGRSQEEGFAQLISQDGSVIAATPNLAGMSPLAVDYTIGSPEFLQTTRGVPLDDDPFRILSRTVELDEGPAVLHVGTTYDVVGESTEALTESLATSIPLVVLVLGALVWWLVGRTLRPVEDIRAEVAAIGAGRLDRRVPQPTTNDEIASLAATMNQMLSRVETAVEQQQRFVADASHELRSPLTRMRSEIEVDLLDAVSADRNRLESIRDEVVELQHLVEDLLHLARSDAGEAPVGDDLIDLDDIVLEEAHQLQAVGRLSIDMTGVSGAQVRGDGHQLRRAIHNLAENAGRHASQTVSFSLAEEHDTAVLAVVDDGTGIPADHADRIFERFGRVDDSRARSSGGTGLGLAIARDIARRHGGDLTLEQTGTQGARFVLRLPLA